ncbi:MAG: helix-hairpin-helix domain-containing protein [Elusimicrobiota bacterium]
MSRHRLTQIFKHRLAQIFLSVVICVFYLRLSAFPAFKNSGWSTRAVGMGGTFCAISDDSSAIFYNPAGIVYPVFSDVGFMYAKPYLGLKNIDLGLVSVSYTQPIEKIGTFGLGVNDYGNSLYKENTAILSYSRKIFTSQKNKEKERNNVNLSFGINAKFLYHKYNWDSDTIKRAEEYNDPVILAGSSKSAFTGDIGFLCNIKNFSFGLAGLNLTQPDVGLYFEDKVPSELRLGSAYRYKNTTVGLDVSYRNQQWGVVSDKLNLHGGLEHWFSEKRFAFRGGANKQEAGFGTSFNQGVGKYLIRLDYAFLWSFAIGDNFGSHRLSISLTSIPTKPEIKTTGIIPPVPEPKRTIPSLPTTTSTNATEKASAAHYQVTKVNINTASEEQLIKVGFNTIQARMIIRYRKMKPFKKIKELPQRVREIPEKTYHALKEKITVE